LSKPGLGARFFESKDPTIEVVTLRKTTSGNSCKNLRVMKSKVIILLNYHFGLVDQTSLRA
jgi:hypothetical protein